MADVEKVIEELKFIYDCLIEDEMTGNALVIDNAIQTIRELQNKSDVVCEWKEYTPMDRAYYRYNTECDDMSIHLNGRVNYNYCPYCGRKIKVVD